MNFVPVTRGLMTLLTCLGLSTPAFAALINVSATNDTGITVESFGVVFNGTGGSISNEVITANDPGAGQASISSNAVDTISIDWAVPGLPDAGAIEFSFDTAAAGIPSAEAEWGFGSTTFSDMFSLIPNPARGPSGWSATLTNGTGMKVDDAHMTFSGTGGTIANTVITANEAGAGAAAIRSMGNMIWIDWAAPGFPAGGSVQFDFTTLFSPIQFEGGNWTKKAAAVFVSPEPTTLSLLAFGGLMLARRRRPC